MACKPCYSTNHHPTKTPPFPQPPAAPQPPLLPLPVHLQASPQHPSWPAARPIQRAKKPRRATSIPKKPARAAALANGASAPSKKRMAATEQQVEWTMDSLYSVSPSPSSVPMPTSLLVTARRKVPTARACAVEVAGGGGGVNVGATDELRRLLRL